MGISVCLIGSAAAKFANLLEVTEVGLPTPYVSPYALHCLASSSEGPTPTQRRTQRRAVPRPEEAALNAEMHCTFFQSKGPKSGSQGQSQPQRGYCLLSRPPVMTTSEFQTRRSQ